MRRASPQQLNWRKKNFEDTVPTPHRTKTIQRPDKSRAARSWHRIILYFIPKWKSSSLLILIIILISALNIVPGLIIKNIIDRSIPNKDVVQLSFFGILMVLIPLTSNILGVWQNFVSTNLSQDIAVKIREKMYKSLLNQTLEFYKHTRSGEIISRIQYDVNGIQSVVNGTFVRSISSTLSLLFTFSVLFTLDWKLTLISALILPAFAIPTRFIGKARARLTKDTQAATADFSAYLQERLSITGYIMVHLFGTKDYEHRKLHDHLSLLRGMVIKQNLIGQWHIVAISLFGSAGVAMIYIIGGLQVISGYLTLGTIVAFVGFLGGLYTPASSISAIYADAMAATALFERIFEYLDLSHHAKVSNNIPRILAPNGAFELSNVTISYPDSGGRMALQEVSFAAQKGEMIALVGPSGSGKTTIAQILTGLCKPDKGKVTVDGVNVEDIPQLQLSELIAVVTQEPIFFHASVRENMQYAKQNATDEEILAACALAQIRDVIERLPAALGTTIGERGYKLSGGERQRLAIARVALRNPKIIVLDEATSSLDSHSEALINSALRAILAGRTSLVVAHRLSTVFQADQIIVLDEGRIVEQGTHDRLLSLGGLYTDLYHKQFNVSPKAPDNPKQI